MKVTEKNIDQVVQVVKDNIDAEFDKHTDLLHAFQTVIEWIDEENVDDTSNI